jgi:hypothetical protein
VKNVLVIGGSFSAIPILKEIIKIGYGPIVISSDKSEPGHKLATQSIYCDYSDLDKSIEALKDVHFDYVVPTCNDAAYKLGVAIAYSRKLPGYDNLAVCESISSKKLFRQFTESNNILAPKLYSVDESTSNITYPAIVKPNKSFSGRGISIVNKENELAQAIMTAKANSEDLEYSIEEYVEGTLHSISLFVDDLNIVDYFFVDEFCQIYGYAVDNSNYPSTLTEEVQSEVLGTMKNIISKMRLTRGLLHTQFIKNDSGHKIIEMMRRCPGDLYGRLIELSVDYPYHKNYLMGFVEGDFESSAQSIPKYIARHTESSEKKRTFENLIFKKVPLLVYPLKSSGDEVLPAPYGKSSIIFMEYESLEAVSNAQPNFGLDLLSN